MTSLLLDTATDAIVVAVVDASGELLADRVERGVRAQAMLAVVDEALAAAGTDIANIERIGVGIGPGSFTGLRVGVSTARGIAAAIGVPIASLPTLGAVAWELASRQPHGERVWASIDAQRGQRFVQPFRMHLGIAGMALVPDASARAIAIDEVAAVVGSDPMAEGAPTPRGLVGVARLAANADDVHEVVPDYGREPDAVPTSDRGTP